MAHSYNFCVSDSISYDILLDNLQNTPNFFIDRATDTLHTSSSGQTPDCRLGDALDVITENFPVPLGTSLAQTLAALSSPYPKDPMYKLMFGPLLRFQLYGRMHWLLGLRAFLKGILTCRAMIIDYCYLVQGGGSALSHSWLFIWFSPCWLTYSTFHMDSSSRNECSRYRSHIISGTCNFHGQPYTGHCDPSIVSPSLP